MALLQNAMTTMLRLGGVLLFAGVAAASSYAQDALSPNLSAPLTDNPDSEPTTTLAIDLLAPQRPFIFDPTGASVSANAFDPSIYASSQGVSIAQTDTQLRDSSQTGRASPYAQAVQRLGLTPSGDESSSGSANQNPGDGSFRSALPGSNSGQQSASGDSYQSSWGGSSSFAGAPGAQQGSGSGQSSWGTGRMHADRSGGKQADSLRVNPSLNGELANATSTGSMGGFANANGSLGRYGGPGLNSSRTSSPQSSLRSARTSQSGQLRSNTQSSSTESAPGELTHSDTASGTGASGGAAGAGGGNGTNGNAKDNASAAANALTFFPAAYAEPFTLGESPFSSPGGPSELHFFSPNIFAATSRGQTISLTGSRSSDATQDSLRQAFVHRHTLATSATHYGLGTHPGTTRSLNHTIGQSTTGATEKRSHLSTSVFDSANP